MALKILVTFITVLPVVTILVCYNMAKMHNHLHQMIPFISYSINYPPEQCIGTFGVSISAFVLFALMFVKYKHLEMMIHHKHSYRLIKNKESLLKINKVAMVFGGIGAICMDGVGSFQFHNILYAHLSFAASMFIFAIIHICMVARIEYSVSEESNHIVRFRIFLAISAALLVFPCFAFNIFQASLDQNISAVAEISCTSCLVLFFVSYISESRRVTLTLQVVDPKTTFRESLNDSDTAEAQPFIKT